jgi:hypothetical protein
MRRVQLMMNHPQLKSVRMTNVHDALEPSPDGIHLRISSSRIMIEIISRRRRTA